MYWLNIHVEHKRVNGRGQSRVKTQGCGYPIESAVCIMYDLRCFNLSFFFFSFPLVFAHGAVNAGVHVSEAAAK